MNTNKGTGSQADLARLTIDIPKKTHKRLKAIAAFQGKSMREYVNELIAKDIYSKKIPNKKTLDAISDVEKGKDLINAKDAEDLFEKLGL